jgi:DNA-binding transcriptional regulator YhcF (GntR family)
MRKEERRKKTLKVLINRLIDWLKSHGISASDIVDCISYITGK